MRTNNPRVVLPFMWAGIIVMSVLWWLTLTKPFLDDRALARDARTFLSTPGTIIETGTRRVGGSRRGSSRAHVPTVSYGYTVGGVEYRSSTLQPFPPSFPTSDEARRDAAVFQPGSLATVFYDPAGPERSVLRREASSMAEHKERFLAIATAIIGLGWLFMLVATYRFLRHGSVA